MKRGFHPFLNNSKDVNYPRTAELHLTTVMCLSIGTSKIINFPFVPNGKFIIFRYPKSWAHCRLIIICLNIGTPNNHHFPFGTNGKVVVLGVPILKHFRVIHKLFVGRDSCILLLYFWKVGLSLYYTSRIHKRPSVVRTLMTRVPRLFRTRS